MEWIGIAVGAIIALSIAFEMLKGLAAFLSKIDDWAGGPKEWFGSWRLRGSFRPRLVTVSIFSLALLLACALIVFFFAISLTTHSDWLGTAWVIALVLLPLGCKKLWAYLREREHVAVQVKRDKRALEFRDSLCTGTPPPQFSLYHRPFESTNQLHVRTFDCTATIRQPGRRKTWTEEQTKTEDFEKLLAIALDSYAPLIALGRPGEQVGAGRILTTDERWREDFRALANAAHLILLMPSPHAGTAWELKSVLSDWTLLSKTVFIIPPHTAHSSVYENAIETFSFHACEKRSQLKPPARAPIAAALRIDGGALPLVPKPRLTSWATGRFTKRQERVEASWLYREKGNFHESGLAFRWDRSEKRIAFSAPLVVYAHPSPLRFVVDLWLSRQTTVVSHSRLKRNLLRVVECSLRTQNTAA